MNDRFSSKLLLLRLIRGWFKPVIGIVIGALVVGLPYYVIKVSLAPEDDLRVRVTLHVEYAEDSSGHPLDYINEFTWVDWAKTDLVIDSVMSNLSSNIEKETVRNAIEASIETDARVVQFDITTKDASTTEEIAAACKDIPSVLSDNLAEIKAASTVSVSDKAYVVDRDIRLGHAFLLGGVLGLIFTVFGMVILYVLDESVYIPLLFTERFGVKMYTINQVKDENPFEGVTKVIIGKDTPEFPDSFKDNSAVLYIESGAYNKNLVLSVIYELEDMGISIAGAVLTNPDEKLIKAFMAPQKFPNPFVEA